MVALGMVVLGMVQVPWERMTKGSKRKLIRNLGKKRGQFGIGSQHEQQISFILIIGGEGASLLMAASVVSLET